MEIIQTISTILFGVSGLCFLLLAVFDRPLGNRQRDFAAPAVETGSVISVAVRLLRATLAKLKLAAVGNQARASRDLEKAA